MRAVVILSWAVLAAMASGLYAETAPSVPEQPATVVAQAPASAKPAVGKESSSPAAPAPVPERVTALEKETVVLREDLGKARLDARSDLETVAKRQAEAIERLRKELADTQAKLEAERAAQARRNRKLWLAIGVVALGALVAD